MPWPAIKSFLVFPHVYPASAGIFFGKYSPTISISDVGVALNTGLGLTDMHKTWGTSDQVMNEHLVSVAATGYILHPLFK